MQHSEFRSADSYRVFQHGIENRVQVAGRAADGLKHIGGRGLLLERITQFVKQPSVLDSDDGLGSEVLHKLDLLTGERTNILTEDGNGADQLVVLEHRYSEMRSRPGGFD